MLKGPIVLLYITICLCVLSDKKTFLVSALGLNWPHSDSRTNQCHLDHKLPGWVLFTVAQWKKMQRKKNTFKLLPQSWFFFFSFFTETRNSQMQVKKQKIFYNIKKSSAVRSGYERDPEHWALMDSMAFGGCMGRKLNTNTKSNRARRHASIFSPFSTISASVCVTCQGLQRRVMEAYLERSSQLKRKKKKGKKVRSLWFRNKYLLGKVFNLSSFLSCK